MGRRSLRALLVNAMLGCLLAGSGAAAFADEPPPTTSQCSGPRTVPTELDPEKSTRTEMMRYQQEVSTYAQALMDFRACVRTALERDLQPVLARLPEKERKGVVAGVKAYIDLEYEAGSHILDATQKFNASVARFKARCDKP
jgi:hypothetical protein